MIYLLSIIFVLSVLVFFHELGHFMFAKLFGVRVERFSIGFPPRLIGVKIGETDYCISAIPFGGYVKMTGVIDESMDTSTLTGAPYEFASKKWWQKTIILVGGVTMNMILAWVIISGLLHFEGEPIIPSTTVGQMAQNGVSQKAGMQIGDKILSINGTQVSTWNNVRDLYFENLGGELRVRVLRDGTEKTVVFDRSLLKSKGADQLDMFPVFPAMVGEVLPNSPAQKANLQRGDKILSIDGKPIRNWDQMTDIIQNNPDKPLDFTILHNGSDISKTIIPETADEIDENGVSHMVGKIGISIYYEKKHLPFLSAFGVGFNRTIFITGLNIKGIWWLISGKKSARDMLGGPIMITKLAGEFAKSGFANLLELIANLSIVLALINILPVPALDGGHIAIVFIEEIRRKPLTTKTKLKIQQVGMAILFVLIIFVMYNDILRIFTK
jgi:regulator of sigma E protease